MKKVLLALVVLLCQLSPAWADTLKAGIQVDDGGFRENVLDQLEVGQPFDPASLPKTPGKVFTELPPWLPGMWSNTEATVIDARGTRTSSAISVSSFGGVYDRYGRPWMRVSVPTINKTDFLDGLTGYSICYPQSFLLNDDQSKYTQKMQSINFVVRNGVVASIGREINVSQFTFLDPKVECVQRPEGKATATVFFMKREQDVANIADAQKDFALWARKVGRADLIP